MDFTENRARSADHTDLPAPVYESVVRSLYGDLKTLAVGATSVVIAPLLLFQRTGDPVQLWFGIILAFLGMLRLLDGMFFRRAVASGSHLAHLHAWEMRYAVLGALYVGALGSWCMVGFLRTSDEFVHEMSVIVTLSYLIGIMGRNFSSAKVVLSQTVFAGFPLILSVTMFGDWYDMALGFFLLPLFVGIWLMSRNLRLMLFNAVLTAIDHKVIADRFDVALSNVAHGIAMLDSKARFVVVNTHFAALCGLAPDRQLRDTALSDLGDTGASVELNGNRISLRDMFIAALSRRRRDRFDYMLADGRVIEAKFNPMADDGGVFVLEDISERVSIENEIRKLASFDPLTHLPNRRFFMAEVNRVIGGAEGLEPCNFLFVDLDNFKDINDTLGHTVGDKLLCSVALRMRARMPENAMACRFGGDEFVIVVPGKLRRRDCATIAETLIEEISKPAQIDGHQLTVGASIGIAQCPANGRDYNHLLKVSDVALYDAKARGRGCYSFYTEELGDVIRDRRQLENELRRALDLGQFEVYYQPLIDMTRNRITTCEALLRWHHPEKGMIPPGVFIPVAEEIGFIAELGAFVLDEATRQCMQWPQDVSVAVNVSSLQFQQSDIFGAVGASLAKSGLPPERLEIEVTESAMLANVNETTATLKKLSDAGVRISLDDFGTGFSSLSYLHTLPLHKVKIDRSFIEDVQNDERSLILLSGVAHLAHELGLIVAIEGVETAEQMEILCSRIHVNEMQGYLFGRAMPARDMTAMLGERDARLPLRRTGS